VWNGIITSIKYSHIYLLPLHAWALLNKQSIRRHQTLHRYRNAASGSRLKVQPSTHHHTAHYGQNVTSSIKPEVHNVSQRRQRRTEPRPQWICIKNLVKLGPAVPGIYSQTDTQTDRQTNRNTPLPYRGGVIIAQ